MDKKTSEKLDSLIGKRLTALLVGEKVTKEDFLKLTKTLLEVMKKIEERAMQKMADIAMSHEELKTTHEKMKGTHEDFKTQVKEERAEMMKNGKELCLKEFEKYEKEVEKCLKEYKAELEKSVQTINDQDFDKLYAEVVSKLPTLEEFALSLPKFGERIRDGLEILGGDERLRINAINGLEERLNKLEERPVRGGGTSAIGVAQAFKYIAHTEAPVGAIDGVNLTYTVKNNIWWIAGFSLNGEQIAELPNFTYSGRTITFASAIPAAYSGKDWEIKYIG